MSRALAHRIRQLEDRWHETLLLLWKTMSPQDQRAVLDAAALTLVQQGVLPPADPTRPDAPMDVLRREAPAAFRQWHQAYLGNRDWHERRPEAGRAVVVELARRARTKE